MPALRRALACVPLLLLIALPAAAQSVAIPVEAFGHFRRMAHTGDVGGKVKLATLAGQPGTYGVGALAGLRGELLLWDGRMLVSRGSDTDGRTGAPRADDEATLFARATVQAWTTVDVPAPMTQQAFEAFVLREAAARGLDATAPFPFAVRGTRARVSWHVVTGPSAPHGGGHSTGSGKGHAQQRDFTSAATEAVLLGFHAGEKLEGVISHPGERFHVHVASPDFATAGHVDAYEVSAGAQLLLPAR